jgi:hypothetical protein
MTILNVDVQLGERRPSSAVVEKIHAKGLGTEMLFSGSAAITPPPLYLAQALGHAHLTHAGTESSGERGMTATTPASRRRSAMARDQHQRDSGAGSD